MFDERILLFSHLSADFNGVTWGTLKRKAMHVLVNHKISDPDTFWGTLSSNPPIPEGFKVLVLMAGTDASSSACLWNAPDVNSLKALVDKTLGDTCVNTYMAVNDSKSFGL